MPAEDGTTQKFVALLSLGYPDAATANHLMQYEQGRQAGRSTPMLGGLHMFAKKRLCTLYTRVGMQLFNTNGNVGKTILGVLQADFLTLNRSKTAFKHDPLWTKLNDHIKDAMSRYYNKMQTKLLAGVKKEHLGSIPIHDGEEVVSMQNKREGCPRQHGAAGSHPVGRRKPDEGGPIGGGRRHGAVYERACSRAGGSGRPRGGAEAGSSRHRGGAEAAAFPDTPRTARGVQPLEAMGIMELYNAENCGETIVEHDASSGRFVTYDQEWGETVVWCICGLPSIGAMIQCSLCNNWGHALCAGYFGDVPEHLVYACHECRRNDSQLREELFQPRPQHRLKSRTERALVLALKHSVTKLPTDVYAARVSDWDVKMEESYTMEDICVKLMDLEEVLPAWAKLRDWVKSWQEPWLEKVMAAAADRSSGVYQVWQYASELLNTTALGLLPIPDFAYSQTEGGEPEPESGRWQEESGSEPSLPEHPGTHPAVNQRVRLRRKAIQGGKMPNEKCRGQCHNLVKVEGKEDGRSGCTEMLLVVLNQGILFDGDGITDYIIGVWNSPQWDSVLEVKDKSSKGRQLAEMEVGVQRELPPKGGEDHERVTCGRAEGWLCASASGELMVRCFLRASTGEKVIAVLSPDEFCKLPGKRQEKWSTAMVHARSNQSVADWFAGQSAASSETRLAAVDEQAIKADEMKPAGLVSGDVQDQSAPVKIEAEVAVANQSAPEPPITVYVREEAPPPLDLPLEYQPQKQLSPSPREQLRCDTRRERSAKGEQEASPLMEEGLLEEGSTPSTSRRAPSPIGDDTISNGSARDASGAAPCGANIAGDTKPDIVPAFHSDAQGCSSHQDLDKDSLKRKLGELPGRPLPDLGRPAQRRVKTEELDTAGTPGPSNEGQGGMRQCVDDDRGEMTEAAPDSFKRVKVDESAVPTPPWLRTLFDGCLDEKDCALLIKEGFDYAFYQEFQACNVPEKIQYFQDILGMTKSKAWLAAKRVDQNIIILD
ncbi:hypothetical protein CYMTET_13598 [Cymbomonas tetramitiformis]|uniref:Zinc finger PHD-type domain-containing protein n=1 Tax=Cymbomonas tetramitiformis TaxID=36881 RepID=A0AAE0GIA5_9CHLO|nr:hypothetical protein CYMTET_13598 [Cymbomonas tetramitiformis]